MAAMSMILKSSVFSFTSRAFPQSPSLSVHRKVSRVCFTSASRRSEGKQPRASTSESDSDVEQTAYEVKEKAKGNMMEGMEKTKEFTQEMKEKANEGTNKVSESAQEAKEKAQEGAQEMQERTKSATDSAFDMAKEMKDKTVNTVENATQATAEKAKEAKEKTGDMAESAGEKTRETVSSAAGKAKSTGEMIEEKAKETVAGAWDMAKDASQKIKETVVGKSGDKNVDVDDFIEDHVRNPKEQSQGAVMDEDVAKARRKASEDGRGDESAKKY